MANVIKNHLANINPSSKADVIPHSLHLFTDSSRGTVAGYVMIAGRRIIAVAPQTIDISPWIGASTRIYELGERLVCPGFHDNHTFFTGYLSMHRGVDLTKTGSRSDALERLKYAESALAPGENLYAWGWRRDRWQDH